MDTSLAPPNDHKFDSADISGDEDFGGMFFYYINSIFQWSSWKIEKYWEVFQTVFWYILKHCEQQTVIFLYMYCVLP